MNPQYEHDCEACVFLGRCAYVDPHSGIEVNADLYHCKGILEGGTIVARVGDEPADYASTPVNYAERDAPFSSHGLALHVGALILRNQEAIAKDKS